MKGYILIPEKMWQDMDILAFCLNESYDYVMSLPGKIEPFVYPKKKLPQQQSIKIL